MNKHILNKTLLAVSICAATTHANALSTRIIGGTQAQPGSYPWMVSLQSNGQHFCGASMVARDWVLTAAHCVEGESAAGIKAVIGEFDLNSQNDGGQKRTVSRIIMHPKRQASSNDHDIALLQLKTPVTGSPVIAATSTVMQSVTPGKLLTVMGWGNQSTSGEQFPNKLFEVQVPYVSNANCGNYSAGEITENMLCAGFPAGGKDSCQGDSGGPLLYQLDGQWQQVGIVSFGEGCAQPDYPGVYARVAKYNDWIDGHLSGEGSGSSGSGNGGNTGDSGDSGDTGGGSGDTDGSDGNGGSGDSGDSGDTGGNNDSGDSGDSGGTGDDNDGSGDDWWNSNDDYDGDYDDGDYDDGYEVGSLSPEIFNLSEYIDIFAQEGKAEEVVVLLENMTEQPIKITDITSDSAQFAVAGKTCKTLQPGATCVVSITYTPAGNQDYAFGTLSIVLDNGEAVAIELYGEDLSAFEDGFNWDDGFDWFSDDDYWYAREGQLGLFGNAVRTGGRAVMSAQVDGPGVLEFDLLLPDDMPENSVTYLVDGKPVRSLTGAQKKTVSHRTELSAGKHQVSWVYKKRKETSGQVKVSKMKFTKASGSAAASADNGGGGSSDLGFLAVLLLGAGVVRKLFGRN